MNILIIVLSGLLFFLLSPNILLRLPKNGSKYTVAIVHAVVFSILLFFIQWGLDKMSWKLEGFMDEKCTEGTNEDNGPFYLEKEDDPESCKVKPLSTE